MRRRSGIFLVVVLAAAVGTAWHRADAAPRQAAVAPEFRGVDPAVPEAKLLDSVLYVDAWREFGKPVGFTGVREAGDIEAAKRFWADVRFVPAGEAAWFADLTARARAAVLR